jgi:ABC-type phosphate transport system substrate-binding protein
MQVIGLRKLTALSLLLVLSCVAFAVRQSAAAESFRVIVNASNPIASMRAQQVSDLFMKKASRWEHGEEAEPVDLQDQSPIRESFSRQIHDKSTAAIKAYWQKMIFSGREVPPPEKASSAEVVAYVRSRKGAIGYVAMDAALGAGVKVVRVVP